MCTTSNLRRSGPRKYVDAALGERPVHQDGRTRLRDGIGGDGEERGAAG
jgi:hypothetical protein